MSEFDSLPAPSSIISPGISICFPYTKLLMLDLMTTRFPNISNISKSKIAVMNTQNQMTVKDIFDFTPSPEQVMVNCSFRRPGVPGLFRSPEASHCYAHYNVTKFFKQQYICYMFVEFLVTNQYDFLRIGNSLDSPGVFFTVHLNDTFFNTSVEIQTVIHRNDVMPQGNKAFPLLLSRNALSFNYKNVSVSVNIDRFNMDYSVYVVTYKPPPYTTDCRDYSTMNFESREDCFDKCFTKAMLVLADKVPFASLTAMPIDKLHVSTEDNANLTYAKAVVKVRRGCQQTCRWDNCNDKLFVTNFIRGQQQDTLEFAIYSPKKPIIFATWIEKFSFSQYFVQLLSCFGIWFTIDFTTLYSVIESFWRFLVKYRPLFC